MSRILEPKKVGKQAGKSTDVGPLARQAFAQYPEDVQSTLLQIRQLILQVHAADEELGDLDEVLRWDQLTFLTSKPVTGSMLRLGMNKQGKAAMFFHCGTSLVETFRAQYSHVFEFEGNRALLPVLPISDTQEELSSCIRQTLRYKLKT